VSTDQTERVGVEAARHRFAQLGWFCRESVSPDYGIDVFVETADTDGRPNGRLLGVQVKSGSSYLAASGGGIVYVDQSHVDYWSGFSLPVIVVVYNPDADVMYWEVVTSETIEETDTRWKVVVPATQTLDADALLRLASIAAEGLDRTASALNRLRADLTWMEVLEEGGSLRLEVDEWVNKTSGRGDIRFVAELPDGTEIEREFVAFFGLRPYREGLPDLVPWADLSVDDEALDSHDEEEWMNETGIWDSEEKRYIGNSETFQEWRASRYQADELRPVGESAGEVDHWRLKLELNDLGRGVLAFERYLAKT
jgi:hypothetical protein